MATTFGILTFLILCSSAFVAWKNNDRMKLEIERKNTSLTNLDINEKELKRLQGILNALPDEIAGVRAETETARAEEVELQDTNRKLKSDVEVKTNKIASNDREYEQTRTTLLLVGEPNELVTKAKEMRVQSEEFDVVIANKESQLENLNAENTSAEDLGRRLKENLDIIGRGSSLPTMKTKIQHIYPNWGFVTLAGGYRTGVTGGSSLNVVRDGNVIGKLVVSTVERSSASASIVPDSIPEDITLRVGDQVVPAP